MSVALVFYGVFLMQLSGKYYSCLIKCTNRLLEIFDYLIAILFKYRQVFYSSGL